MSPRTIDLTDQLYTYLLEFGLRESDDARALREKTLEMGGPAGMQISPEQGQFMGFLARLIGAERAIEIGTFTGYSALCVAQAMGPHGRLIACDVSEEWTAIGRQAWRNAGVEDRIDLRIAPGLETLDKLIAGGAIATFDLAFIDADKPNYIHYYERLLQLVRRGGLILVDNVLWGGSVADPENQKESTEAIRAFNALAHEDERVDFCLVPVGDGVTMLRRR